MPAPAAANPAPRCPRCSAPVTGAYKFCPTCAFRLRTDLPDGEGAEPSPWRARMLVVGLVAGFFVAAALGGIVVLKPAAETPPPPTPTIVSYETPVLTVEDIPDQLVDLGTNGWVGRVEASQVADLSPEDRARIEEQDQGFLWAVIWYPFRAMRYEVTQGQFAEFARDAEEHPEVILAMRGLWWGEHDDPAKVSVLDHVPRAWLTHDERGRVTGWSLEDSRSPSPNLPVTDVSYLDAAAFARWAAKRLDLPNLTLPVHAEWLRMARGGKLAVDKWPWGNARYPYALNHSGAWGTGPGQPNFVHWRYSEPMAGPNAGGKTVEGLYAMAGNVWEWASGNAYVAYVPPAAPGASELPLALWESLTPEQDKTAVAAGGSYRVGIDDCQIDSFQTLYKYDRRPDIGFRLVDARRR